MDEKTFELISKLNNSSLTFGAAKKLSEPNRTEKLFEIIESSLLKGFRSFAVEVAESICEEQKKRAFEIILDYTILKGHLEDAIKTATCLGRPLTIDEVIKILEIQISSEREDDAKETAMLILREY